MRNFSKEKKESTQNIEIIGILGVSKGEREGRFATAGIDTGKKSNKN